MQITPIRPVRLADDRHVVPLAGVAEHRRAGGVARDHQGLDALLHEVVEALEGVLAHLADRLGAVGLPGGVTDVDDRLVRQLVDDGAGHGEATEARVEDSDGSADVVPLTFLCTHNTEG